MGGGVQSKPSSQTDIFSNIKQLWCSVCLDKFQDPVKLPCGHKVCGPNSSRKCAKEAIKQAKCEVPGCEYELKTGLKLDDLEKVDRNEKTEYENAIPLQSCSEQKQELTSAGPARVESRGFSLVGNIQENGRKKLLIIGETGTGKSSLCNVIAGLKHNAHSFLVSDKPEGCTQSTQFGNIHFNGNRNRPINVIDTIGFNDPEKDEDAKAISDMTVNLKCNCDYVNLIVIVVNGQQPRLDDALINMIQIFEKMFGDQFWKQAVVIFTRLSMDSRSKKQRKANTGSTDDERAQRYMKSVEKKFPKGEGLRYLLIDAWQEGSDQDEEEQAFENAMETLWQMLDEAPELRTIVVKSVETESAKLRKLIAEKEEELQRMKQERVQAIETLKIQKQQREYLEHKHQTELDTLRAARMNLRIKYEREQEELQLEMEQKIAQNRCQKEALLENLNEEFHEKRDKFEKEIEQLIRRQKLLRQEFEQRGRNDQELRQQIEQLEHQKSLLKNSLKEEKQKLDSDHSAKVNALEKENQEATSDIENKINQLKIELARKNAHEESSLRDKQLQEISEISNPKPKSTNSYSEIGKINHFERLFYNQY